MASRLSPQLFAILSGLVEDRLGLQHTADDLPFFSEKVTTRAAEAGFENILDYYYFLRYDPAAAAELESLTDALVVGETYFFRELEGLRAAVDHVLVPTVARKGRARVWSAACATGEEPLSMAMLLAEAGIDDRCQIVATDVSQRAIARAREGTYTTRAMRLMPPGPPPAGWTAKLAGIASEAIVRESNRVRVSPAAVAAIDYRQLNLLDADAVKDLGSFELILCRNVLIYFADATVVRVVASLAEALADDGSLLVGASASLLRFGTVLQCTERGGAFFYTRGHS